MDYDHLSSLDSVELILAGLRKDALVEIADLAQRHQNSAPNGLETQDGSPDDDITDVGEDHPTKPVYRTILLIARNYFDE